MLGGYYLGQLYLGESGFMRAGKLTTQGAAATVHKIKSGVVRIINWDDLGYHFGQYIPDYKNFGSLTPAEIEDFMPYRHDFGDIGAFKQIEVDQPGLYRRDYKNTGEL